MVRDTLQDVYNISVNCSQCTWAAVVQRPEPCAQRPPQDALCLPLTLSLVIPSAQAASATAAQVTIGLPVAGKPSVPYGATLVLVPVDATGAGCLQQSVDGVPATLTAVGCPGGEYTLMVSWMSARWLDCACFLFVWGGLMLDFGV